MIYNQSTHIKRLEAINYVKSLSSTELDQLKNEYIQYFCEFHDEYAEVEKAWFEKKFNDCLQENELNNFCMFIWLIPLFILSQQHKEKSKPTDLSVLT